MIVILNDYNYEEISLNQDGGFKPSIKLELTQEQAEKLAEQIMEKLK